ncbi:type II secretion system protein [Candidatus Uhrbacteria bacterium]|nr:type II secretion system protein [Candidatus Uhrbacteria bacterium]
MKIFAKRGFTLVELLLYVGILATLMLVTSLLLSAILQARVKSQTIAEVEQQGAQAMHVITQTLRNADGINSPGQGLGAASLSVNTYTLANNPTLFDLSGGIVRITEGAGQATPLTNTRVTVSSLSFQNFSRSSTPGTIRIQFIVSAVNASGSNEYDFQKTFIGSASLRQP